MGLRLVEASLKTRRDSNMASRTNTIFWILAACSAVLLVSVAAFTLYPRRVLNVAGFSQIKNGMTTAEVEALLGGPPGDYRHRWCKMWMTREELVTAIYAQGQVWFDDDNMFVIYFDASGKVAASFEPKGFQREQMTWDKFIRRMRRWL